MFRQFKDEDKAYQAFRILQATFVIGPIIVGVDRFFYFLVNWSNYLAPFISKRIGGYQHGFMMVVGAIEIITGIGMLLKPRVFAYLLALWLCISLINFLLLEKYLVVALRELGLLLSAVSLGKLSEKYAKR